MFGRKLDGGLFRVGLLLIALALLCTAASAFTIDGYTFEAGTNHTLYNAGSALTYYPVSFTLSNATGTNGDSTVYTAGTTMSDWRDIRFTSATNTVYPYWIESTTATTAIVWVNVSSIPSGASTIKIYYDSDTAPSASNGDATFILFDDFNNGSLNPSKWTSKSGQGVSLSGGVVSITAGSSYPINGIVSVKTIASGVCVAGRVKPYHPGAAGYYERFFAKDGLGTVVASCYAGDNSGTTKKYLANSYYCNMPDIPASQFFNQEMKLLSSKAQMSINNANIVDITTAMSYSTSAGYVQLIGCQAGGHIEADWIYVRNCADIPPTQGTYTPLEDVPVALFSADVTTGSAPLTVHFTDLSTHIPTSWAWNFGDGGTSTIQNPTYTFYNVGNYSVSLTATNLLGSDNLSKVEYISVTPPPPEAAFISNQTTGLPPLVVQFTDQSTNSPTAWSWNFGDGQTSTAQNPTHTFTALGSYTVSLTATNAIGSDGETKVDYISVVPAPPVAAFSAGPIAGAAPLAVSFADTSARVPTSWAWDFTGDGTADSIEQNPTHTFAANGTYSVTLQVSNAGGTDIITKTDLIYVGPLTANYLKAAFKYTGLTGAGGTVPYTVSFTDTTRTDGGTYARDWNFGDGGSSTEANPVHEYTTAGKYDVSLTAQSMYKSNTASFKKVINIYPKEAITPLPTNTYGAHMTEIMETDFNIKNVSQIIQIIPMAYTDTIPPTFFWGVLFVVAFFMMFIRQGTPWLVVLLGVLIGGEILNFLAPEWQMMGQAMMGIAIAGFLFVMVWGRYRSN